MNTSYPVRSTELKAHFSSRESETVGLTTGMCFSWSGVKRSPSSNGTVTQEDDPRLTHLPRLLSTPTPALRPGPRSQVFNNHSHHSPTCHTQSCCTVQRSRGGGGGAAGGAAMRSRSAVGEKSLSRPLYALEATFAAVRR